MTPLVIGLVVLSITLLIACAYYAIIAEEERTRADRLQASLDRMEQEQSEQFEKDRLERCFSRALLGDRRRG
jgi:Flp pilus assembly protein TadB